MKEIFKKISDVGVVPVVKLDNPDQSLPLGRALCEGNLSVAEITFRTDAAEESIRRLASELPELLVGAGTVLSVSQVRQAISAGAKFIVTPGFNPAVVGFCVEHGILVIPGVNNPSQIEQAIEMGLGVVKFFPAEASGGVMMLKALSGPYGSMRFIPTGGVTPANVERYLSLDNVLAVGGSWMVDPRLINAGRYDEVTRLSREAIQAALGFELRRVGLVVTEAEKGAQVLRDLFGLTLRGGGDRIEVGEILELMQNPGSKSFITLKTHNLERAVAFLAAHGVPIRAGTETRDCRGALCAVELDMEIGGLVLRLISTATGG